MKSSAEWAYLLWKENQRKEPTTDPIISDIQKESYDDGFKKGILEGMNRVRTMIKNKQGYVISFDEITEIDDYIKSYRGEYLH